MQKAIEKIQNVINLRRSSGMPLVFVIVHRFLKEISKVSKIEGKLSELLKTFIF